MNINEATMSVNIAGVPRPFRIITKDQGKKEYGAPFYEEVTQSVKSLAEKMRAEKPDTRTARAWIKDTFEKLGVEPAQKAGFLTQLMRYKDAAALADDLYDITIDADGQLGAMVGEEALNDKVSFGEAWDKQSEDERASHLTKAGYDGEELSAYKKFEWDNLPPAVRNHVEVVMEAYNPGAANIRLPFHADNLPKAEPTEKPEPEEEPEEKPAAEEPEAEEPAAEEPEEEPAGEEEPKDAIFETQAAYTDYFRKMAGLAEAEPSGGEVPSPESVPLDPDKKVKDNPELLALIAQAKKGDSVAQKGLLKQFDKIVFAAAKKISNDLGFNRSQLDDLIAIGRVSLLTKAINTFDPTAGAKFQTYLNTVAFRDMSHEADKIDTQRRREKSGSGDDDEGAKSALGMAAVMAQAAQLPPECEKALKHVLDTRVEPQAAKVVKLVYKLEEPPGDEPQAEARGKGLPRSLADVAKILGIKNAAYLYKKGLEQIQAAVEDDPELLEPCREFILSTSFEKGDVNRRDAEREAKLAAEKEAASEEPVPMAEMLLDLFERSQALAYPSEMVARSMEALLLAEGVKIRRKGKKITIPVNEYGRAKKAFEKSGLTMPKKYVSHEADNIRKAAKFSGQYGGAVLDKPF